MKAMRRVLAAAVGMLVVGTVAACSESITANPNRSDSWGSGSYHLLSVNGSALPYTMRDDATGRVLLTGGEMSCDRTTFTQVLRFSDVGPSGLATSRSTTVQGTMTVTGSRVIFRPSTGGEFEGTVAGNRIAYTIQGNMGPLTFIFLKDY